jgi:hypothetical protein
VATQLFCRAEACHSGGGLPAQARGGAWDRIGDWGGPLRPDGGSDGEVMINI